MKVRYSYLPQQFKNCENLWERLKHFVSGGDFTLGEPLKKFENEFARLIGAEYAVGVNSGTDAIKLSLKYVGVEFGDEVITTANTFVATVGAIAELGAKPVFVDCDDTFCMNINQVEEKITSKTKAIVPVHFTGYMTDMRKLCPIAEKYKIPIIEDACQSILASINGKNAGLWGISGAFSFHPLKNINVWSDGGMIVTNDIRMYNNLNLLRNHGLVDRNHVETLGYNSRFDTFQAVVGSWLLPKAHEITELRINNARYYDKAFKEIKQIVIPPRHKDYKVVYHLYVVHADKRDQLLEYCTTRDVSAKVHYPIPIYRQKGLSFLGYKRGDFRVADMHAKNMITFPCDQHISKEEMDYVIKTVQEFYREI